MNQPPHSAEVAGRFGIMARQFCSLVDHATDMNRVEYLTAIYGLIPKLISEAISLPDVHLGDSGEDLKEDSGPAEKAKTRPNVEEWSNLYNLMKEKLGKWDSYRQVFDPTEDTEAVFGSLADDIADMYADLREGLILGEGPQQRPEESIWSWRDSFYSHWGKHAMDALLLIHFRLQNPTP